MIGEHMNKDIKTNKIRALFVIVWSVISCLQLAFPELHSTFVGFISLGFHTPRDIFYYFIVYGLYSSYPQMIFILIFLLLIFIALWIVSILKLKKGLFFEWLIAGDSLIALIMCITTTSLNSVDLSEIWHITVALFLKCVLIFGALISYKVWKQKNAVDSAYLNKTK